jgi:hypothetical protein
MKTKLSTRRAEVRSATLEGRMGGAAAFLDISVLR